MLEVGVCLNHELFTDQNKEVNKQKKMPQKKMRRTRVYLLVPVDDLRHTRRRKLPGARA
jgi:hypothetical protein